MSRNGETPRGPVWKGTLPPEDVARLNRETLRSGEVPQVDELAASRKQTLEKTTIESIQEKARAFYEKTDTGDLVEARTWAAGYVADMSPTQIINALGDLTEEARSNDPVHAAALSLAFLQISGSDY